MKYIVDSYDYVDETHIHVNDISNSMTRITAYNSELYVLVKVGLGQYVFVSAKSGNRWINECLSLREAIRYMLSNMTVVIYDSYNEYMKYMIQYFTKELVS